MIKDDDEMIKIMKLRKLAVVFLTINMMLTPITGCTGSVGNARKLVSNKESAGESSEGKAWSTDSGYIRAADEIDHTQTDETVDNGSMSASDDADEAQADNYEDDKEQTEVINTEFSLSVPTYVYKVDETWFIVDCYHDQIIYNDNLDTPLGEWKVLTKEAKQPHTMASDGQVFLVDDTENNRVLVFERQDGAFVNTQIFTDIGKRPHYTVYDESDKAFYVWSSMTGEVYIFRHEEDSSKMYLTEVRRVGGQDVSPLEGTYIRSFYIDGNEIYFVSGIGADGRPSGILICDKYTLDIKEKIEVSDSMAGMVALIKEGDYFYITISTDIVGDQNAATIIRTRDLHGLEKGEFEDIYSDYFVGGGTPYNITKIDDTFYLTEHRVPGHSVWSFRILNDEITDVRAVY
ncbi:YncE family protein [Butyrivibrio sp. AE3004]|uniref:YncE family protein n=1 Tax=Butyrivibrio sp. AE3004 TaxID=1506994 RepID=UPI00068F1ACA|nr:hypothetical protein [Butyrivibrio sp. AE3004]